MSAHDQELAKTFTVLALICAIGMQIVFMWKNHLGQSGMVQITILIGLLIAEFNRPVAQGD
jgi:hypothetical protein